MSASSFGGRRPRRLVPRHAPVFVCTGRDAPLLLSLGNGSCFALAPSHLCREISNDIVDCFPVPPHRLLDVRIGDVPLETGRVKGLEQTVCQALQSAFKQLAIYVDGDTNTELGDARCLIGAMTYRTLYRRTAAGPTRGPDAFATRASQGSLSRLRSRTPCV